MRLLLLHGWGFDASLWDAMRAELREFETLALDRGYFGQVADALPEGPFLAVGHSLGSLLLALDPPPGCMGLVAINGFDRFTGPERVPARVVARMQAQFGVKPGDVLQDFRKRVGATAASAHFDAERLSDDLDVLAATDASLRCAGRRVTALHGGADPLLPPAMREAVFPGAPRFTHPDAGHLLPLTHPQWCADQIREVLAWA
jgi:pimeloyl-[acyl-carrier protein] methyl ester esterase